jgi:hypothetical protein
MAMALPLLKELSMRGFLLVALVAACGGGDGDGSDPGVDSGVPVLPYRYYVIDHITVPTSAPEAAEAGLDLNGDSNVDNKLGNVIATLSTMGVDANATVARSIDRGETILLARIGTTSFVNAPVATFQTFSGADPSTPPCATTTDTACRHHLDGMTSFTASAEPRGVPLLGKFDNGMFSGTAGQLVVRIALLGSAPIDLVLLGSRANLTMTSDTSIGKAKLAGAVSQEDIDNKVIPAVHENLMASVTRDCTALTSPPACGCKTDSDGKTAIGMFDKAPTDCTISLEEVRDNSLVQALLSPDVTVEGKRALSLGVTATAVMANFSAP